MFLSLSDIQALQLFDNYLTFQALELFSDSHKNISCSGYGLTYISGLSSLLLLSNLYFWYCRSGAQ
jgi:hypothetical protein